MHDDACAQHNRLRPLGSLHRALQGVAPESHSTGSKSEQNIILIIQGALWRSQWTLCKGGAVGIKMRPLLDRLSQKQSIEMRRETIIRSLILYLGEKEEELFEDCLEDSRSDVSNHILKILVVHGADEDPVDVSILVEGHEILPGCNSTAKACSLLMGLIYALNLAYPLTLRYTFEVFQKLMLELDGFKLPTWRKKTQQPT
ncbi:uncharacterized protein [Nerophis lumbriciformis]|uniref:uncharacterized protein n=1 Tax=Nerophis lumbriciformis TaxID=546530 RepID=UPI003BAA011E